MFSIRKFWFDCQGELSSSIAIIMMYLITVCGMGANAAFLVTQKMRLEGVADVIALEAMRGIRDTDLGLDGVRSYALERARHAAGVDSIDVNLLRDVTTIQFGQFVKKSMNFVEDENNPEAAVVTLDFTADTGHPVRRIYYSAAGRFADMSVRRVAQFYTPRCYTSGIAAEGALEFNGTLKMRGDYCLRSNKEISINAFWALGNNGVISAPPQSTLRQNVVDKHEKTGVLEFRQWKMAISKDAMELFDELRHGDTGRYDFRYLTNDNVITVNLPRIANNKPLRRVNPHNLHPERIHYIPCPATDTLVFRKGEYKNLAVVTNCRIAVARYVHFVDMVLVTDKDVKNSIEIRHHLKLGSKETACSSTTGTVFMTRGGIDTDKSIALYDAQMIVYADGSANSASHSTAVLGGTVKLVGSSIFSGGNLQFDKSVNYFDCPDPVSKGIVKHDYIRMGVF